MQFSLIKFTVLQKHVLALVPKQPNLIKHFIDYLSDVALDMKRPLWHPIFIYRLT